MALGDFLGKMSVRTLEESAAFAIGGATTPALEWLVRPVAYELNALNPTLILVPDQLAQVEIKRAGTGFNGEHEAAQSGLAAERYRRLVDSLRNPPDIGSVLALLQRNVLNVERAKIALERAGIDPEWIDDYLELRKVLLSPADAAMARQQGFLTDVEQIAISAMQGVDAKDADVLFRMSGLPPGAEQMIELWRRGEVGEERVRQSLIEGHIKIDYADDVLKLRYQPLSASVAAEALVRHRMTESEAVAIAEKNGLTREDFLKWSDMIGRPIAQGQALQLARRGEFTYAQFQDAVARSDVRTEFAPDLWKLKRAIPNLFQLRTLISSGAITEAKGIELVTDLGYDHEIAAGIVHAAKTTKTKRTRDLAASQIDALYESGLETRQWALDALQGLGYAADEAEWHLELLDAKRILAALQSRINLIHRQYINHKKDQHETALSLDGLGISPEARDLLMSTWDNEREEYVVRLTNAQIGSAVKYHIISDEEAVQRWIANGYPAADADILIQLAHKAPHNANSPTH